MKTKFLSLILLSAAFAGCDQITGQPPPESTVRVEMRQNEQNQQRLSTAVPAPVVKTSIERKNLKKRIERINTENMVSYVYLLSQTGKVVAYYTINGKVSSLNSYLTAMERTAVVDKRSGTVLQGGADSLNRFNEAVEVVTLEAPDLDGSYGKNVEGIFFFTTEGAYVEWNGQYLWSDQPLKITQQPELIQEVR